MVGREGREKTLTVSSWLPSKLYEVAIPDSVSFCNNPLFLPARNADERDWELRVKVSGGT